jgi:Leucine-rich repeat (LRR) protein
VSLLFRGLCRTKISSPAINKEKAKSKDQNMAAAKNSIQEGVPLDEILARCFEEKWRGLALIGEKHGFISWYEAELLQTCQHVFRLQGTPQIPTKLWPKLSHLQGLGLLKCQVDDAIVDKISKHLPHLTVLHLNKGKITFKGTEAIASSLKSLTSLDLSYNSIGDTGTAAIAGGLKSLTSLDLTSNQISEAGAIAIAGGLKSLTSLDLTSNQISEAGAVAIADGLKSLTSLNLGLNQIGDAGAAAIAGGLKSLTSLDLDSNQIGEAGAAAIADGLKSLTSLVLHSNQIGDAGAAAIADGLKSLTSLHLSGNQIGDAGAVVIAGGLKSLTSLVLRSNQIGDAGAAAIAGDLKSLATLDLSYNQIGNAGAVAIAENLTNLRSLALWHNQLTRIPQALVELPHLEYLGLIGNNLQDPPQEIADQGLEAMRNYFRQKQAQGTEKLFESRLLIVGEPGAGKTSLMRKLLKEDYVAEPGASESTTGVNVETGWTFPTEEKDQPFQVNIWDFGGQEIQYTTHQFFLSPRVVYVLLADGRKQHTLFDYWFNVIQLLGDGSPVLVALNERENCKIKNYDHGRYQKAFQQYFDIDYADTDLGEADPRRFKALRSKIENFLLKLPHIGTDLPANWPPIRRALTDKAKEANTISLGQYFKVCTKNEIEAEADQMLLLRYLNDLGVLLHYEDSALADTVFLNPHWVLDAVYALLQSEQVAKANGCFSKGWLFELWEEKGYSVEQRYKLLELLLRDRFELVYPLQDDEFITPQLLPEVAPEFEWPGDEVRLRFRFQYPFKPHGIVARLIVRFHNWIHENKVWRRGVLFKKAEAIALVKDTESKTRGDKIIQIELKGPSAHCKDLLDDIRCELRSIHSNFKGLVVNEEDPVPQNPDIAVSYLHLLKQKHKGRTTIPFEGIDDDLVIDQLLEGLEERTVEVHHVTEKTIINNNNIFNPTNHVKQVNHNQANASNAVDIKFNFQMEMNGLQGPVAELVEDLRDAGADEIAEDLEAIQTKLEPLEEVDGDKAEIKKKARGPMNKVARFLNEVNDKDSKTRKAIEGVKSGVQTAQELAGKYNKIAQWCGLPVVPDVFL